MLKLILTLLFGISVANAACSFPKTFGLVESEYQGKKMVSIKLCSDSFPIKPGEEVKEVHNCFMPEVFKSYLNGTVLFGGKKANGKYRSIYRALRTLGFENEEADFDMNDPNSKISQFMKERPGEEMCVSGVLDSLSAKQAESVKDAAQYLADDMNRFFKLESQSLTGISTDSTPARTDRPAQQ